MDVIKETKLGVKIIVAYTWLTAIIFGLFSVMFTFILIKDPGTGDMGIAIIILIGLVIFAYLFAKLAIMTLEMKLTAWWAQMIVSSVGLFSLNPISLIIMIYLWINRDLFGISTSKDSTDHQNFNKNEAEGVDNDIKN